MRICKFERVGIVKERPILSFTLPLEPQAIQNGNRIGFNRKTGRTIIFSDKKKVAYQGLVAAMARKYCPAQPMTGPICLGLKFILPRPKYLMRSKYEDGLIYSPARPDRDNLMKGTVDGITSAGFWLNDGQICAGSTDKFYCEENGEPRIIVTIEEMHDGRAL